MACGYGDVVCAIIEGFNNAFKPITDFLFGVQIFFFNVGWIMTVAIYVVMFFAIEVILIYAYFRIGKFLMRLYPTLEYWARRIAGEFE